MQAWKKTQSLCRQPSYLLRQIDTTWLTVGRLCLRCKSEELYKELGFKNFDTWIYDAVGCSRSRAYVAMRAARDLVPIRDEELSQITMQGFGYFYGMPTTRQGAYPDHAQIPNR